MKDVGCLKSVFMSGIKFFITVSNFIDECSHRVGDIRVSRRERRGELGMIWFVGVVYIMWVR